MADCAAEREGVAHVAGRVLLDWKSGRRFDLGKQIEWNRRVLLESSALDVCEREKLEVFLAALECLEDARQGARSSSGENDRDPAPGARYESVPAAQVRAAILVLEHLANGPK